MEKIGSRQQQILTLLLENKAGLSIDEVAAALGISRNAVQQHFAVLERDGCIQAGGLSKTAGRPVRSYVLTNDGINCLPKQYAWFSELLLDSLKKEMGAERFQRYLHNMGVSLSQTLKLGFEGKDLPGRVEELVKIMEQLGFHVKGNPESNGQELSIEACNCIYHDLAQKHEEICEFDRALIESLLAEKIEHRECMAKGGHVCRFCIRVSSE